jgi:hypothetical protein
MATKPRVERPNQTIKVNINPLSEALKQKCSLAVQAFVNAIKAKHL